MKRIYLAFTLVALALCLSAAMANDGCGPALATNCGNVNRCAQCGRCCACQPKTCQVVCEIRKEKKSCWCVQYEDFCPLLPGCRDRCADACNDGCCRNCGERCGRECCESCGKKCPVPPRCAQPKCLKKLVKKEYEVDVPVYKCVVKYLCGDCCAAQAAHMHASESVAAPLPPILK